MLENGANWPEADTVGGLFQENSNAPSPRPAPSGTAEDWLRLAFVGLPAGRCQMILDHWQGPAALLEAAREGRETALLATPGVTPTTVERLREVATRDLTRAWVAMETHDIRLLLRDDPGYPVALHGIPDPPPYLFVRGTVATRDELAVAMVGTRHATDYGKGIAHKLAYDLAQRGITVVSGLARGIDTHSHRGALEAGGRTFAVCGCGLDIVYPSDNKELMQQVTANGAAFSEFAPTVHPEPWHFPARNRIISGLSCGVIVVEAGERSGALITSDFALEQGREVFAVPGNIHKPQSRGTHGLIKQGATLIESADDVVAALNNRTLPFVSSRAHAGGGAAQGSTPPLHGSTPPLHGSTPPLHGSTPPLIAAAPPSAATVRPDLTADENRIFLALDVEPRHVDELAESTQMGAAETSATLVMLELKGVARRLPGSLFVRT